MKDFAKALPESAKAWATYSEPPSIAVAGSAREVLLGTVVREVLAKAWELPHSLVARVTELTAARASREPVLTHFDDNGDGPFCQHGKGPFCSVCDRLSHAEHDLLAYVSKMAGAQ